MPNLDTNILKDLYLSSFISDTGQITTYVEQVSSDLIAKITDDNYLSKRDGGEISADINISGDLSTTNNIIAGTNNVVGCNGLKIVGIDKQNLNLSCQYSGTLDVLSAAIKDQEFTLVSNGSQGCDAIVLDVNETDEPNVFQLSISKWYLILDNALKPGFYPYFLTFINNPSFGDEIDLIDRSYCFGYNNKVFGSMCLAEGRDNMCIGNYAHTEGRGTTASWGSHAEGHLTYAERAGSHAEGKQTRAEGYSSHAEGHSVSAIGDFSHAAGVKTNAKDNGSFVWQGVNANGNRETTDFSNIPIYESHGIGTFNIKPLSGIDGFFIDDKKINEQFPLLVDGKIKTDNLPVVDYAPGIDTNKLEYIENTDNTFFIDTGIPVASLSNCTTEITFMINQPIGGIFGYRINHTALDNYGIQINTDNVMYITPGDSITRLQINYSNKYISKKLKACMSINRRALYDVDTNTLIGETDAIVRTTFSSTSTCYLFGFNGGNMSGKQMNGRIYDVKIYENESKNVLWHFVPYIDIDTKEIGFYDIANKKWIYKQLQSETFKRGELLYNEYEVDMINMKSQIKEAIDLKDNFAQYIISTITSMSETEINKLKTALGLS